MALALKVQTLATGTVAKQWEKDHAQASWPGIILSGTQTEKGELIQTFSIVKCQVCLPAADLPEFSVVYGRQPENQRSYYRIELRISFSKRVMPLWNKFPESAVRYEYVSAFERDLHLVCSTVLSKCGTCMTLGKLVLFCISRSLIMSNCTCIYGCNTTAKNPPFKKWIRIQHSFGR